MTLLAALRSDRPAGSEPGGLAPGWRHPSLCDPWEFAAAAGEGVVMAVLTGTEGPAYRNPGAAMAIAPDGRYGGAITSGSIEADLILRADEVRRTGLAQDLRYGQGSPFIDLTLPCGGAIEVRLFLLRDISALQALRLAQERREAAALTLNRAGRLRFGEWQPTGQDAGADHFHIGFRPGLRFAIFGSGAEVVAFAGMVRGVGYDHFVASHEEASLAAIRQSGSPVHLINRQGLLEALPVDAETAVVLFYHDHDYEPQILAGALRGPAFYIGAQGSRATHAKRLARLAGMGISTEAQARIRGPIGLIPSSREPVTLAISVLAEVIAAHQAPVSPLGSAPPESAV